MKHISLSLLAIGLLLLSSCFEDDKRLISADDINAVPLHFYANIEAGQDSSLQTKSTLSGTSTDATRKVLWEPSDSIYVTNGTNGAKFNNITPENSDVADFSGKLSLGTNYYAAFPYGIVSGFEASAFQLTLPTVQTYKADGIGSESFPMVAQCINNVFEFKNLCGILVLNLKGSAVIDSIRFSGTDDAKKPIIVSGAASVSTTYTDAPSLEMDSTAVDYVILNCIGSTGKGVNLDSNKPTPFHIVLPASTYAHFSVVIYSSEGKHMTINSEKPLTIKRSKRTTTSSKEYEADKPVYEYVDLGLSVNWATINVGAEKAGEKGEYYAWGEIETKEVWNWKTYKHATSDYYEDNVIFTKYVTQSGAGKIDNKSTLELEDDVAHVKWGGNWRIPTMEEMNELIDNCTFTWTTVDGVNGLRVTSNIEGYTDQSIFLPAAGSHIRGGLIGVGGYCEYWTSSLWTINSSLAYNFRYSNYESKLYVNCYSRYEGLTIRPVCPKDEHFNNATITLNYDTISIEVGATDTLVATIKQGNEVIDRVITWTTADSSIAIVNESGLVTGISVGTTKITAIGFGKSVVCDITVMPKAPEYVNLGLSVNWATFNIGANKPEDTGIFYAWGETTTKDSYSWANYTLSQGTRTSMTKYCFDASAGYNGFTDSKTVLDPEDDIAHVKWGNNWRIPTKEEYEELINNCTWQWTSINGIYGYKISGRVAGFVNNFIFLPAIYSGGYTESRTGLYWSSSLSTNNANQAYRLQFIEEQYHETFDYERYLGHAIRPVTPSSTWLSNLSITLNNESITLERDETTTLTATVKKSNDEINYPVIWSSDKPSVATVNESGLVTAVSAGTANIVATIQNKSVTCSVTVTEKPYEYVDLGLSVNWATFNVGATKPEEYGTQYAWGEINSNIRFDKYRFVSRSDGVHEKLIKYCTDTQYGINGSADYKTNLELVDDIANIRWGDNWRIPSKDEFEELLLNCTWQWKNEEGVNGYRITSNIPGYNNNYIFIPAGGYTNDSHSSDKGVECYYWSNYLNVEQPFSAWFLRANNNDKNMYTQGRPNEMSIRPVVSSDTWAGITSLQLNQDIISIAAGQNIQLIATVKSGENTVFYPISWSSSNSAVAKIDNQGNISALSEGNAIITASCYEKTTTCTITVTAPAPEYVDLGLSVNWATFNVGANKPEDYGDYYAWGEIETKSNFSLDTYAWYDKSRGIYTEYQGTASSKTKLKLEDDVAHVQWGGGWRMPTLTEIKELHNSCTWVWKEINGVYGYEITSNKTGYTNRSIFLPAAGWRYNDNLVIEGDGVYWTSSRNPKKQENAYSLQFASSVIDDYIATDRVRGFTVRPVYPSEEWIDGLSISMEKENIVVGLDSTIALMAIIKHDGAEINLDVSWTSSDPSIASVDFEGYVSGVALGTATVTATCLGKSTSCTIKVVNYENGYEYVDLGLSVKWATCNVGALSPEKYGDYYAWGEVETKDVYDWNTYIYGSKNHPSKYNINDQYGDGKSVLEPLDDVASVKWGGTWRIPSRAEYQELVNECTWTWTSINGINGYLITGKKAGYINRSIFLPAAGLSVDSGGSNGYYWQNSVDMAVGSAKIIRFDVNEIDNYNTYSDRAAGHSIRPVCE